MRKHQRCTIDARERIAAFLSKCKILLFEGHDLGQYSARSAQQLFREAVQLIGVDPYATKYTFRHSFARNLL